MADRATPGVLAGQAPRPLLAEPAVALTDLLLAVETGAFALALARVPDTHRSPLRRPLVGFFAASSLGSLAGAVLHGPVADRADPRHEALWRIATASVGVAAASAWWIGAELVVRGRVRVVVRSVAGLAHVWFVARAVTRHLPYGSVVAAYLPGAAFLGVAAATRLRTPADRGAAAGILAALTLTFAAAAAQVRRISPHPVFDHNALYHALQAAAMLVFFGAARRLLRNRRCPARPGAVGPARVERSKRLCYPPATAPVWATARPKGVHARMTEQQRGER